MNYINNTYNMDKESLRIIFMGTPDFAVESLKALVLGNYNIVAVVTTPDKPVGRHGNTLQASPVKIYAQQQGIYVLQPEKLKDENFVSQLRELNADLQVVVAFRMLPEVVWNMPRFGTFNLHASLLPQYRGAAPINWAVINGEKTTGVTTFFLDHQIDTGEIIKQVRVDICDDDNAGDVHDKLMKVGAKLVTETIDKIIDGTINTIEQRLMMGEDDELKPAPKIFRDTCRINWEQPAKNVYNFVRGLSPYPASWTVMIQDNTTTDIKVFKAEITGKANGIMPGHIDTDGKSFLKVATQDQWVNILQIQAAGKKKMTILEFLIGRKLDNNVKFI